MEKMTGVGLFILAMLCLAIRTLAYMILANDIRKSNRKNPDGWDYFRQW